MMDSSIHMVLRLTGGGIMPDKTAIAASQEAMTITRGDGSEPVVINSVRVSCKSDPIMEGTDYAFFCVYTIGDFPAKKVLGRNIYPGYFYIRRTDAIIAEEAKRKNIEGNAY